MISNKEFNVGIIVNNNFVQPKNNPYNIEYFNFSYIYPTIENKVSFYDIKPTSKYSIFLQNNSNVDAEVLIKFNWDIIGIYKIPAYSKYIIHNINDEGLNNECDIVRREKLIIPPKGEYSGDIYSRLNGKGFKNFLTITFKPEMKYVECYNCNNYADEKQELTVSNANIERIDYKRVAVFLIKFI